jgi:hypothetical protein
MDTNSVNSGQSKAVNDGSPLTIPAAAATTLTTNNNTSSASSSANPKEVIKDIGVKFTVKHAFGSHSTKLDPLQSFAALSGNKDYADRLIHKIGRQVCIYDPETNTQEFFDSRPKNVIDVLHYTMSANGRFIAMCESIKHEKVIGNTTGSHSNTDPSSSTVPSSANVSQVSVYSLSTLNRLKTMHYSLPKPFICSTFCGDPKLLAALSDEPDRHIVIWYWEKEKVYKTCAISLAATILRSAPSSNLMLTTSGPSSLKNWCIAPDGSLKPSNFLPPAKESLDIYSDHLWLPSNLTSHRMVTLVDPDPSNEINRTRKQCIYIFEGSDNNHSNSSGSIAPIIPILMELKQTIALKLDPGTRIERIIPNSKAFLVVGNGGLIAMYERTDDKHDPYIESKRFTLNDLHIVGATVYPSEERMVVLTKSGRLLTMQMDITIDQIKKGNFKNDEGGGVGGGDDGSEKEEKKTGGKRGGKEVEKDVDDNASHSSSTLGGYDKKELRNTAGISDLTVGGYHTGNILAADIAYERPLIVTIGADATLRVWNYMTEKCELVHYFRNDEPISCAVHNNGFQVLISFKDRIRLFNILMDKIKFYRETVLKNCKCLRFSNGGQYWAAASAINVTIYDTKSFTQLITYQGHMMTVVKLAWAPGDQVLFSAGLDGNVYGWPIHKEGKIEVISANNRSSAILDLAVDCSSTVFPLTSKGEHSHDDHSHEIIPTVTDGGKGGKNSGGNVAPGKGGSNAIVPVNSGQSSNHPSSNSSLLNHMRSWLIVSSLDGHVRMPHWSIENVKSNNYSSHHSGGGNSSSLNAGKHLNSSLYPVDNGTYILYGDSSISITAMQLSTDRGKLFVGTSTGALRIYPWPPDPNYVSHHHTSITTTAVSGGGHRGGGTANTDHSHHGGGNSAGGSHVHHNNHPMFYYELFTHAGPVVSVRQGPLENMIISAGADGSVFIHTFHDDRPKKIGGGSVHSVGTSTLLAALGDDNDEQENLLNQDVILLAFEDVEDHVNQVVELQKLLSETKAKNEFQARKLDFEHNEALKRITDLHDVTLNKEKENYEKQRLQFDKRIRELIATIEAKENDHIKVITELENKYEHKLADQLERYDLLSEKMTLLKQKCEGLLESEKSVFLKQIGDIKVCCCRCSLTVVHTSYVYLPCLLLFSLFSDLSFYFFLLVFFFRLSLLFTTFSLSLSFSINRVNQTIEKRN